MAWFLAQVDPVGGSWEGLLATYGPFAPFAALLLLIVNLLWKDSKGKDAEIKRLTDTAMERTIPLVLEATRVLADASAAMRETHASGDEVAKLVTRVESVMAKVDDLYRELHVRSRDRRG